MAASIHYQTESRLKDTLAGIILDDLDGIIDKIADELRPDQVFDEENLMEWVKDNKTPEDVFSEESLESWARDNGFTRPENVCAD